MPDDKIKLALLLQEKANWENTRTILEIRYRVNKRLGNQEQMNAVQKDLENCEAALDELSKMELEMSK
jgi:hypothetical protein